MSDQVYELPSGRPGGVQVPKIGEYDLACKLRALWAVMRREIIIFVRYPSWIVALLVWPLLLPLVYIFGSKALAGPDQSGLAIFAQYSGTTDYVGFIALGSMLWMWMNMVLWDFGGYLRREQVRGTLESNWLSPVPRVLMLVGTGLSSSLQHTFTVALSLLEFYLIMGVGLKGSLWLIMLIVLLTIPVVYGIGMIFASLVIWAKEMNTMVFLVRGIMMIFCGVTFPLAVAPDWIQAVSKWIPLTYSVRSFRAVYLTGANWSTVRYDLLVLLTWGVLLVAAGMLAFQFTSRIVRKKGTLGVY